MLTTIEAAPGTASSVKRESSLKERMNLSSEIGGPLENVLDGAFRDRVEYREARVLIVGL